MWSLGNALLHSRRAFLFFRRAGGAVAALMAGLLLAGCSQPETPADLVIINGPEPESLDPAVVTGQADMRIVRAVFEGLTRLNAEHATPEPALAERWEISEDGTVYTFHLRTNALWSTGQPITAHDVYYSWRRILEPATAADYSGQLYFVRNAEAYNTGKLKDFSQVGITVGGEHTLRVELDSPTPFFLDLVAFPTLAVVPRFAIEKHGDRWLMTLPVPSSGPYQIVSWRIHDKIRVRRNPNHWDAGNVGCEVVDFLPMDSATTALNLYFTGQADVIWDKNLIPSELMDVVTPRPDCHVFDYLGTYFYRYNVTRKPFDDVRVRKALALAVDKRRLVEKITRGGEKVASHLTPLGTAHYEPPQGLGHDPEEARRLLAEAGYPGGSGFPVFQYLFRTGKMDEQIAVELQAMWEKELGIRMELRQAEWKVYLAEQAALNFDVSRSTWIGDYNDPNTFLDMFMSNSGNNRSGWKNPRYDDLIRRANRMIDLKARANLMREAEQLLVEEELPIVPLYFYVGVNFFDPAAVEGIYFNLLDEHPVHAIRRIGPRKLAPASAHSNQRSTPD